MKLMICCEMNVGLKKQLGDHHATHHEAGKLEQGVRAMK